MTAIQPNRAMTSRLPVCDEREIDGALRIVTGGMPGQFGPHLETPPRQIRETLANAEYNPVLT